MDADPRVRKQYRVDFEWLISAIAGAAGVAARQRRACLVDDQLWDLGDARLGHKMRPVLFARRLNSAERVGSRGARAHRPARSCGRRVADDLAGDQFGGAAAWAASHPPHPQLP